MLCWCRGVPLWHRHLLYGVCIFRHETIDRKNAGSANSADAVRITELSELVAVDASMTGAICITAVIMERTGKIYPFLSL